MSEEIELQLRLDQDGRTSIPPSNDDGEDNKHNSTSDPTNLDYTSKCVLTKLAYDDRTVETNEKIKKTMDDLLFDCEITDSGLLPRTFWMPAQGTKPRCALEQCAYEVFHKHVPKDHKYDCNTSGAEWWVQIRPSPTAGRYAMHAEEDNDDKDDMVKTGISFHWDKDEDLRLLMGGSMYIHPHISTVTYMTSFGSPTMALDVRIHPLNGEWIVPPQGCAHTEEKQLSNDTHTNNNHTNTTATENTNDNHTLTKDGVNAYISWPERGKHLSFDGRYLHAAPGDFMEKGEFDKQIQFNRSADEKQNRLNQRRHRRVTFLVNVWLNYKPFNVNMFPETMIDKLTKVDNSTTECILFDNKNKQNEQIMKECDTVDIIVNEDTKMDDLTSYTWPLGACGCGEKVSIPVPLERVRNSRKEGNCKVCWNTTKSDKSVVLMKEIVEKIENKCCEETTVEAKIVDSAETECLDQMKEDSQGKCKHRRLLTDE